MSSKTARRRKNWLDVLLGSQSGALRVLLANSHDGISVCEWHLEGARPVRKLVFCNESFIEMSGYTREALLACPNLNDLTVMAAPGVEKDYVETIMDGRSCRGVASWLRPDGMENVHEWVAVPVRVKSAVYMLGTDRDVTERLRAQAALEKARAESLMIFNSVPALIWYKDTDNRILRLNRAAAESLGRTVEELEGCRTEEVYPQEASTFYLDDLEVIRSGQPKLGIVESIKTVTGETRWLSTDKVPQFGRDGQVTGVVVVAQDVTLLKEAEEANLRVERKMQDAQKLESLGVLAGGIAHDFNNLLMVVLGNVTLARLHSANTAISFHINQIEKAGMQAADLCQQMLAYVGKGKWNIGRLCLSSLIAETAHLLHLAISKKAVLKLELAEPLPSVLADVTQMRQVLMNLVINASEAIGEEAGVIRLSTGAVCTAGGECVFLEVHDTGCGMDRETVARIFDPFFTTKFTGRGLGLAAVQGIVRGHQGTLNVESTPGQGTVFRLLLPTDQGAKENIERPGLVKPEIYQEVVPRASSIVRKGTVLIVDDEPDVRTVTAGMVEVLGFDVLVSSDGYEGLNAYLENSRHIVAVLLDLTMPRLDGEQMLRELRKIAPTLPVVLISGFSQEDALARVASFSKVTFLEKPFSFEALHRELDHILHA